MTANSAGAGAFHNGDPRLYLIITCAHDMAPNGGWPSPTNPDAYVDYLVCAEVKSQEVV